jgi:glycosyltransferase involved in cell wall biosynthesis
MKIAVFHELPKGGARSSVLELCKHLQQLGNDVSIYYTGNDEEYLNAVKSNYFYKFSPKQWKGKDWKARLYKDTLELLKLNSLHKTIAGNIDSGNYDVVIVNGSEFIETPFILKHLKSYTIFYCHDQNYRIVYEKILSLHNLSKGRQIYENLNRSLRKIIDKRNFSSANEIYANSEFVKKIVKETYDRDSKVVYLGIDTGYFTPKYVSKDIDVLFIGSYHPIDGYDLLKKAISTTRQKIVVETVMSEDRWLEQEQIRDLYQRSKIVACLAHNEPFGLVALESMSCGTPVIAVNEGGYRETVINSKTGFLIERNVSALLKAIITIIQDQRLREKISKSARQYVVDRWDWKIKSTIFNDKITKSILR